MEPLQKLSKLIQEILKRTEPNDILVFCPSGVLHGVPLHAATLTEDSRKCLLERNPVVYTASMTTFEQCVTKESERELLSSQTEKEISRFYVAVYERTETDALTDAGKAQRDAIYATVRKVAEQRRQATTTTTTTTTAFGSEATRERLVAAFEADYMYFFGHCVGSSATANMLLQGLVLPEHNNTSTHDSSAQGQQQHSVFTASDMFAIDVRTSCLTLLACGSAHEAYSQGDEPLGIVSALLCAGATSVIGTMWKVQVGTARVFTEVLDGKLNAGGHGNGGGGLVDLAVAVQETALRLKRRQEGGTNRPYHWAAYVLHGSWFMSRRGLASLSLASS
jgi:CHAT domain-containing protein